MVALAVEKAEANIAEAARREPASPTPFNMVQDLLELNGQPFSLRDYPYLEAIYNTAATEVGLFTGRQIAKSTTLASKSVLHAVTDPKGSRQVIVSPLQEQAYVFSTTRLRDFIHESPIIKECFFRGMGVVDQMLRKQFNNGNMITLGYAQRTADRLRGQSAGRICYDEIQDIMPDVFPVVNEMAFRVANPSIWYCGTPKSLSNPMESFRGRSTACEWAVKCSHTGCKKWNLTWDERNIGNTGVICRHCGKSLDTRYNGQWVAARRMDLEKGKESQVTMESYRIPQLIVQPIMSMPSKWIELLKKLKDYSSEKFYNEVLGLPYDSGSQPITLEQLMRCCQEDRHNVPPDPRDPQLPPLVMGVDWAFTAESSYTFVIIGGWDPFPSHFQVYYWKIFKGIESDSRYQVQEIIKLANQCGIRLIGADWGAGHVQNLELINRLGEETVAQMWHTGMRASGGGKLAQRAKWENKTRKWHLSRTAVLTDTFETCRRRQVTFPGAQNARSSSTICCLRASSTTRRPTRSSTSTWTQMTAFMP